MHTIFWPQLTDTIPEYLIEGDEGHHLLRVMRMQVGFNLQLANGCGLKAKGTIQFIEKKKVGIQVESWEKEEKPEHKKTLAFVPTKGSDRLEWVVEKATELGITDLHFVISQNGERQKLNMDRQEKIAIAAFKQSKRFWLPNLHAPISFAEFVASYPNGFIAHCKEDVNKTPIEQLEYTAQKLFLIGPEGDFTEHEITLALQNGYLAVNLSDQILRTETAALLACMYLTKRS